MLRFVKEIFSVPCVLLTVKIKVVQILVVLAEKEFQTERLTGFAHAHKIVKKRSSSNTSGNKFSAYFHYLFVKTPSLLLQESELNLCDNSCRIDRTNYVKQLEPHRPAHAEYGCDKRKI